MSNKNTKTSQSIIAEKTDFIEYFDLEGNKLVKRDNGFYKTETSEFDLEVPESETLFVENSARTREFFKKYIPKLFQFRGIKNVDEIDENDPNVKELFAKSVNRKQKSTGKVRRRITLSASEKATIINSVRRVHKPHSDLAFSQLVLLSILYYSIFSVKGKQVDTKFDIDIPEAYWRGASPESKDDLDMLLDEFNVLEPHFDEENPLEYMIAFVTTFLEKYPKLFDKINADYIKKAYVSIMFEMGGVSSDEIGFLEDRLDELLS